MTNSVALRRIRGAWWRWPLAIVAVVVLLALIVAGTVRPVSHAATGERWPNGVPFAGYLQTNGFGDGCTVTVVSEFLAITPKHCSIVNAELKLNLASLSEPGRVRAVSEFRLHPTLDLQAIFLRDRSGLTVTPLQEALTPDPTFLWGYGVDTSNRFTGHLTRAAFHPPLLCDNDDPRLPLSNGELCWEPSTQGNLCYGDSGAPVIQNGQIIGMVTKTLALSSADCSKTLVVQAISIRQMQPWLNETIDDANPFPT